MNFEKIVVNTERCVCHLCKKLGDTDDVFCGFSSWSDEDGNQLQDLICETCVQEMSELLFGPRPISILGKPYVGKIFDIKNNKSMNCFIGPKPHSRAQGSVKRTDLPECVVIIDEKGKYLSFMYNDKQYWLSAGYFGKERV